jgi:hypothetical protein
MFYTAFPAAFQTAFIADVAQSTAGVRFPAGAGDFFSLLHSIQTGCGADLPSYPMSTGGYFPGGKTAGE